MDNSDNNLTIVAIPTTNIDNEIEFEQLNLTIQYKLIIYSIYLDNVKIVAGTSPNGNNDTTSLLYNRYAGTHIRLQNEEALPNNSPTFYSGADVILIHDPKKNFNYINCSNEKYGNRTLYSNTAIGNNGYYWYLINTDLVKYNPTNNKITYTFFNLLQFYNIYLLKFNINKNNNVQIFNVEHKDITNTFILYDIDGEPVNKNDLSDNTYYYYESYFSSDIPTEKYILVDSISYHIKFDSKRFVRFYFNTTSPTTTSKPTTTTQSTTSKPTTTTSPTTTAKISIINNDTLPINFSLLDNSLFIGFENDKIDLNNTAYNINTTLLENYDVLYLNIPSENSITFSVSSKNTDEFTNINNIELFDNKKSIRYIIEKNILNDVVKLLDQPDLILSLSRESVDKITANKLLIYVIIGVIALLIVLYGIYKWKNA